MGSIWLGAGPYSDSMKRTASWKLSKHLLDLWDLIKEKNPRNPYGTACRRPERKNNDAAVPQACLLNIKENHGIPYGALPNSSVHHQRLPGPGSWSLVPGPGPWSLVPGPWSVVLVPGPHPGP